jgi:TPR repeat protein
MLKFGHLPALLTIISMLFFAGQAGATGAVPVDKPDPAVLLALAQAETDPAAALPLYCEAAQAGSGPAQTYMGRMLTDEKAGTLDLAAGMLWLDRAILSGEGEARELRRMAGRLASPKDFERYRIYNNSQRPIPCGLAE